jgi:hypothetical protein
MSYETTNSQGRGSINHHLTPMTIAEMNETFASHRREGFEIINRKIWRAA